MYLIIGALRLYSIYIFTSLVCIINNTLYAPLITSFLQLPRFCAQNRVYIDRLFLFVAKMEAQCFLLSNSRVSGYCRINGMNTAHVCANSWSRGRTLLFSVSQIYIILFTYYHTGLTLRLSHHKLEKVKSAK